MLLIPFWVGVSPADLCNVLSPVPLGLITPVYSVLRLYNDEPVTVRPLKALRQRSIEVDLPTFAPHPPCVVSFSGVTACLAVRSHSVLGRRPSDDATPGSCSELKVAANCSLVWQRWPMAFLPSWLTDCCGELVSDRHI